nr:two-component regulator propeller domain-containing protein [Saprospiraceae bacterium]
MKAYNYLYINIAVLFLSFINCKAQQAQVFLYTTNDGLPQNSITNLMFDKDDRLWIGTNGGLTVYNGQNFTHATHNKLHPRIMFLSKDRNKTIFIVDGIDNLYEASSNNTKLIKLNNNENYMSWYFNETFNPKFKNYHSHYRYLILLKLGYKNIKNFSKNGTSYLHEEINIFENNREYFLVDSTMVIQNLNKEWALHSTNGSVLKGKTKLPEDMNDSGLIFQSDHGTFWLYQHTIYQLKIKKDSI